MMAPRKRYCAFLALLVLLSTVLVAAPAAAEKTCGPRHTYSYAIDITGEETFTYSDDGLTYGAQEKLTASFDFASSFDSVLEVKTLKSLGCKVTTLYMPRQKEGRLTKIENGFSTWGIDYENASALNQERQSAPCSFATTLSNLGSVFQLVGSVYKKPVAGRRWQVSAYSMLKSDPSDDLVRTVYSLIDSRCAERMNVSYPVVSGGRIGDDLKSIKKNGLTMLGPTADNLLAKVEADGGGAPPRLIERLLHGQSVTIESGTRSFNSKKISSKWKIRMVFRRRS